MGDVGPEGGGPGVAAGLQKDSGSGSGMGVKGGDSRERGGWDGFETGEMQGV